MRTLSERIMADARREGNPCIRCGSTGSTCGRHLNGFRQHKLGKGRGIKVHPICVADFCDACDKDFQEGSVSKDDWPARIEYSEEFLFYCTLSTMRRFENGVLV